MVLKITTRRDWMVQDVDTGAVSILPKGEHEMVKIRVMKNGLEVDWLVVRGERIGRPETAWRSWTARGYGDFQVDIEEIGRQFAW